MSIVRTKKFCRTCGNKMFEFKDADDIPWLICEKLHGRLYPVPRKIQAQDSNPRQLNLPSMSALQ